MKRIYLLSACLGCSLAGASPDGLDDVRTTIGEWVASEKAISREALDWQEEKVLLQDLIDVAEKRAEKLEAILVESEAFVSTADAKRSELLGQRDAVEAQAAQIEDFLAEMEARLLRLKAIWPEPLQAELAALYQRFPEDAATSRIGLGERMQTVVGMLTQIRRFDAKVTVSESIRPLPEGGGEASFRTLWFGLGQAYYLAPDDAGYGIPGPEGWVWHSQPKLATAVREGIALVEGTATEPRLLELPVQLTEGGAR